MPPIIVISLLLAALAQAQVIIIAPNDKGQNIAQALSPMTATCRGDGTLEAKNPCFSDNSTGAGFKISKLEFMAACKELNSTTQVTEMQYNGFAGAVSSSKIDSKKEAAMFLAHLWTNSGGLQKKREESCLSNMEKCAEMYKNEKGGKDKIVYYGRGYMQLAWDYNYKEASNAIFKDDRLLTYPELVAEDECLNWRVAAYYWDMNVHDDADVKEGKFGASTKKINKIECTDEKAMATAKNRFKYYSIILKSFGIKDVPDESGCY